MCCSNALRAVSVRRASAAVVARNGCALRFAGGDTDDSSAASFSAACDSITAPRVGDDVAAAAVAEALAARGCALALASRCRIMRS